MTEALVQAALWRACATGAFHPLELVDNLEASVAAEVDRDYVLQQLSLRCSESFISGDYLWRLGADARRHCFAQVFSRANLRRLIEISPPAREDDYFGRALQTFLREKIPSHAISLRGTADHASLTQMLERLATVYSAAQFARHMPILEGGTLDLAPLCQKIASKIRELQRELDTRFVLPKRLIGRQHYQRRLSRFLRSVDGRHDKRPVLLTGIGGVGKSALLAALIKGWRNGAQDPHCVVLDFDRPRLASGGPVQFMREFLRQLRTEVELQGGLSDDAKKLVLEGLEKVRESLPSGRSGEQVRDFEHQYGMMLSTTFHHFDGDRMQPLREHPIALILDSFEAVDRRGGEAVKLICKIENDLRQNGLHRLRTVVSGRAEPVAEPDLSELFGGVRRRIHLKGLGDVSGGRFLEMRDEAGVFEGRRDLREAASKALHGHPLAIIVLARYARNNPDRVEELIGELERNADFGAEFAQVFLFTRILERIDNKVLRSLAHPGLVLRLVTDDLIRLVLAEPCLGEAIDIDRAKALYTDLSETYWLVEEAPELTALRHRPDLRRQMLPALFAKPREEDKGDQRRKKEELREAAIKVCRKAQRFFETGPPVDDRAYGWWRDFGEQERWVEANYYKALIPGNTPDFGVEEARMLNSGLGEDVDTLPPAWTGRVHALLGLPVTDIERETLDAELLERVEEQEFSEARQQSTAGGSAPSSGSTKVKPKAKKAAASGDQEQRTLAAIKRDIVGSFSAASFDDVQALTLDYLDALAKAGPKIRVGEENSLDRPSLWNEALWLCILVAGAKRIPKAESELIAERVEALISSKRGQSFRMFEVLKLAAGDRGIDSSRGNIRHALNGRFFVDGSRLASPNLFNNRIACLQNLQLVGERELGRESDAIVEKFSSNDLSLAANWISSFDAKSKETKILMAHIGDSGIQNISTLKSMEYLYSSSVQIFFSSDERSISGLTQVSPPFSADDERPLGLAKPDPHEGLVRGLTPELHAPTRAIMETLTERGAVKTTEVLGERARYWPQELNFDQPSTEKASDSQPPLYQPAHAATIVETADRCGVLRDLCAELAKYDMRARDLVRMHDLITDWFFLPPSEIGNHMIS